MAWSTLLEHDTSLCFLSAPPSACRPLCRRICSDICIGLFKRCFMLGLLVVTWKGSAELSSFVLDLVLIFSPFMVAEREPLVLPTLLQSQISLFPPDYPFQYFSYSLLKTSFPFFVKYLLSPVDSCYRMHSFLIHLFPFLLNLFTCPKHLFPSPFALLSFGLLPSFCLDRLSSRYSVISLTCSSAHTGLLLSPHKLTGPAYICVCAPPSRPTFWSKCQSISHANDLKCISLSFPLFCRPSLRPAAAWSRERMPLCLERLSPQKLGHKIFCSVSGQISLEIIVCAS